MEKASKHVITDDNIPETCKALMTEYPAAAVDVALADKNIMSLLRLIRDGEVHVVDKVCAAKVMFDRLAEQPNAVIGADMHVMHLKREVLRFSDFLDSFGVQCIDKHVEIFENVAFDSDLVRNGEHAHVDNIKCLWKLLKTWKADGRWVAWGYTGIQGDGFHKQISKTFGKLVNETNSK